MRHGDPALNEYFNVTCQNCATVLLTVRRITTKPQPSANMTPQESWHRRVHPARLQLRSAMFAKRLPSTREALLSTARLELCWGNAGTWFHSMNEPGSG